MHGCVHGVSRRRWGGHRTVLAGIGGIIGAIIASAVIPILKDDESFAQIRDWVAKPGPAARYRDLITYGLHAAGQFYGPNAGLSLRGYAACLVVALVYPIFLWQFVWVLDGLVTMAGTSVFYETMPTYQRWIGLSVIWASLVVLVIFVGRLNLFVLHYQQFITRLVRRVGLSRYTSKPVLRAISVGVAVFAIGAVAVVVAAGGFFGIGGVVGLIAVAMVGVGIVFGVGAVAGWSSALVAFIAGAAVGADTSGDAVVFLTLLLFVPAANAVLDHASVQVSRWLLTDLVKRRGAARQSLMMAGHVFADLVFAVAFLVMLAVLLPAVLQFANRAFDLGGWPVVEWGLYLEAARREPFGAGLLVTGMLATTLIPTILHMLAAGGALALPAIGGGMIRTFADKPKTTLLDRIGLAGLIALSAILSWATLVVIAVILWEAIEAFVGPLGGNLADLAESVGRAIGGPGAPGP